MFLAAIDKFDAMMSKGNTYAPDGMSMFFLTSQNSDFMIATAIYVVQLQILCSVMTEKY